MCVCVCVCMCVCVHACVLVFLSTELQQSVNSEEEWVMTMAARLTNYRHLARLKQLMREKGKLTINVVECVPLCPPHIGLLDTCTCN